MTAPSVQHIEEITCQVGLRTKPISKDVAVALCHILHRTPGVDGDLVATCMRLLCDTCHTAAEYAMALRSILREASETAVASFCSAALDTRFNDDVSVVQTVLHFLSFAARSQADCAIRSVNIDLLLKVLGVVKELADRSVCTHEQAVALSTSVVSCSRRLGWKLQTVLLDTVEDAELDSTATLCKYLSQSGITTSALHAVPVEYLHRLLKAIDRVVMLADRSDVQEALMHATSALNAAHRSADVLNLFSLFRRPPFHWNYLNALCHSATLQLTLKALKEIGESREKWIGIPVPLRAAIGNVAERVGLEGDPQDVLLLLGSIAAFRNDLLRLCVVLGVVVQGIVRFVQQKADSFDDASEQRLFGMVAVLKSVVPMEMNMLGFARLIAALCGSSLPIQAIKSFLARIESAFYWCFCDASAAQIAVWHLRRCNRHHDADAIAANPSLQGESTVGCEPYPYREWKCPFCGSLNSARFATCEACRAFRLPLRQCPRCSFVNMPLTEFCSVCERPLNDSTTLVPVAPWKCTECGTANPSSSLRACRACGAAGGALGSFRSELKDCSHCKASRSVDPVSRPWCSACHTLAREATPPSSMLRHLWHCPVCCEWNSFDEIRCPHCLVGEQSPHCTWRAWMTWTCVACQNICDPRESSCVRCGSVAPRLIASVCESSSTTQRKYDSLSEDETCSCCSRPKVSKSIVCDVCWRVEDSMDNVHGSDGTSIVTDTCRTLLSITDSEVALRTMTLLGQLPACFLLSSQDCVLAAAAHAQKCFTVSSSNGRKGLLACQMLACAAGRPSPTPTARCIHCYGTHPSALCEGEWKCSCCGASNRSVGAGKYFCSHCVAVRKMIKDELQRAGSVWFCKYCHRAVPSLEDSCVYCNQVREEPLSALPLHPLHPAICPSCKNVFLEDKCPCGGASSAEGEFLASWVTLADSAPCSIVKGGAWRSSLPLVASAEKLRRVDDGLPTCS